MLKEWKQKKILKKLWKLFIHDYKRNRPKKIWVEKGTEFAEAFKRFCAAEGTQVYSTMSETKAAFAERPASAKAIFFSLAQKSLSGFHTKAQ